MRAARLIVYIKSRKTPRLNNIILVEKVSII